MDTAEQIRIAEIDAYCEAATPKPWTTEKPDIDSGETFAAGVIIAAVARGQGVYADPPGGSYPESDRRFIANARTDLPWLSDLAKRQAARIEELERRAGE